MSRKNRNLREVPSHFKINWILPHVEITKLAIDCYLIISWKKPSLKEVTSNFKINWILPHVENTWDCHSLLFTDFMEGKNFERGTVKFQDQMNSSTFWKYVRLPQIGISSFHGRNEVPSHFKINWVIPHLKINEIATDCYLSTSWKKKLERGTLTFQDHLNASTLWKYMRLPPTAIYLCHGRRRNLKEVPSHF